MTATVAIEEARGTLPETRTYSRREWSWLAAPGSHLVTREGTLTIMQTSGRRVIRTQVSHYAVQVEGDEYLPAGVYSFLLENELEPDHFGPFRCIVGGAVELCGCEAGGFDKRRAEPARWTGCKHRAALMCLVAIGVFA